VKQDNVIQNAQFSLGQVTDGSKIYSTARGHIGKCEHINQT